MRLRGGQRAHPAAEHLFRMRVNAVVPSAKDALSANPFSTCGAPARIRDHYPRRMNRNTPALVGFVLSLIAAGGAFIVGFSPMQGGSVVVALFLLGFPALAGLILGIVGAVNAKRNNGTGQGHATAAIVLAILMFIAFALGGFLGGVLIGT